MGTDHELTRRSEPARSFVGRAPADVYSWSDTFAARGEIYVKMLPNGEAVQLTQDNSQKMSPAFSPDDSQIAYTVKEAQRISGIHGSHRC